MPRGRHRHSPPLHRLLPPSVIAGVAVVCAAGPWLFTEPLVLRGLAAGAAATMVVGAVVMRRWDVAAGKHVADLTRARASDEWHHEERVAELETDLEESRELRTKLEQRLRAKRTELANLRNEHAALLRRYATAETERATALEGRRLLAIESTAPAPELPAGDSETSGAQEASDDADRSEPAGAEARDHEDVAAPVEDGAVEDPDAEPSAAGVFSPDGSSLFMRAGSALERLTKDDDVAQDDEAASSSPEPAVEAHEDAVEATAAEDGEAVSTEGGEAAGTSTAADEGDAGSAPGTARKTSATTEASPRKGGPGNGGGRKRNPVGPAAPKVAAKEGGSVVQGGTERTSSAGAGPEQAAAPTAQQPQPSAKKPAHSTGHFTVPTAVAVVPPTPRRRATVEGGFDFFGTQKSRATLDAVQNEDLADVVGQEALAMHKAESESGFKPADPQARAVGQVIDLTAHDETEQIDVQGLRTAAS
ncbi:hypothetical protein PV336_05375 [Streptomyces sp. MI02-2A]|uniref:hypothetical protein n=1 Tax=unclassified Streptomyces TaxID=2593676 RepID=UPI000740E383|nr:MULTISPECIES: hypothetical protein [unclassified Streptomyces]KUJ33824.1 hypothetical protein ADL25_44435 [Streptomyces sp. NRRL F-5122]MDX3258664.1 hypothetical protein [Streptomyces sp. MI02-2A]REE62498.1 hypothetical protein BX257_5120 [Streptomyces sp. 3212.3]